MRKIESSKSQVKFTLGFKFVVMLMLTLIPLMLGGGLILINQVKQVVTEDIDKKSKSYASFLAKVSRQGIKEADLIILKRYVKEISSDKDVLYILVADNHNKPIIHSEKKLANLSNVLEVNLPLFYKGERTGVIRIWYSFSRVAEELTGSIRYVIFFVVSIFIFLIGLAMFLISEKLIFNRIAIIIKAIKQVEKGNLSTRINPLGRDELGFLATQFNNMAIRLEDNQHELNLLSEVSRAVTAAMDIKLITELVMGLIVEQLRFSSCSIFLMGEADDLILRGSRGFSTEFVKSDGLNSLKDIACKALTYHKTLVMEDFNTKDIGVVINIPLLVGDKKLGVLNINAKLQVDITPERIELLEAFGRHLAVAIQNTQLYERTQRFSLELEEKIKVATGDLERANERLKLVNEKLSDLSQAKSEFITIVSHELRSPLTSVLGFTDLLLEGEAGSLSSTQKEFIDIISQNTRRQIDLINNLLNLSKIEAGRVELKKQSLDLSKVIQIVVANLRALFTEKNLEVKINRLSDSLPQAFADENQIILVLTNLLSNAIKYTAIGDEIVINLNVHGEFLQMDVLDSGEGIESKELPLVFGQFYRSSKVKTRNIIGTGLGLTISKSIIDKHGGKIWVESPLSQQAKEFFAPPKRSCRGVKFTFTLPISN